MNLTNIALLMLSATLANHLGLVEAIEGVLKHQIPILNCSKCASFWAVLIYTLVTGCGLIASVAVSFVCAFLAVWLELLLGGIDVIYGRIYENLFTEEAGGAPNTEADVSELRKQEDSTDGA